MHREKAFTLVELLVVIAIIALLTAILLPTLSRVRKQARAVACQMNLKQWATTLALYLEQHQGRFPRTDYSTIWLLTGRDPNIPDRARALGDFGADANKAVLQYHPIRTKGILCPMASKPATGEYSGFGFSVGSRGVEWGFEEMFGGTFRAWVLTKPGPPFSASYGLNRWLFDRPVEYVPFAPPPSYTDIYSLRRTAGVPLLLDSRSDCVLPTNVTPPPEYEDAPIGTVSMTPVCMNRHNGYVNCLFLDWSIRKVGLKELWTLKWHKDFDTMGPWTNAGGRPGNWPYWMRNFKDY